MNQIYRDFGDHAEFYVVYVHEAHPSDAWQLSSNVEDDVIFPTPSTPEERAEVAGTCVRRLALELPMLIDDLDDSTETAYTAWPDRLYLIDAEGRVAYKSRPGPFGFEPDELREALLRVLDTLPDEPPRGDSASL